MVIACSTKKARALAALRIIGFRLGACICLICGLALRTFAETPRLHLEVSPQGGTMEDAFQFSVVIDGLAAPGTFPYLVGGDDFKLTLIGPQTSVNINNGVVTSQVQYAYQLLPKRTGELETPGAEIEINGQKLKAAPLKVKIGQAKNPLPAGRRDLAFVTQSLSKESAYVGEQLLASIDLYTSVRLEDMHYTDLSYDGFWSQAMKGNEGSDRTIDGRHYNVWRMTRALFPLAPGVLHVPARELSARAIMPGRSFINPSDLFKYDPMDPDFLDKFMTGAVAKEVSLHSNSLDLVVLALPKAPEGFPDWQVSEPIVGHTNLEASYDPAPIKPGDSKTVEVKVTSLGNLTPYKAVPISGTSDLKIYPETPQIQIQDNGGQIITVKTFKLSLVPVKGGDIKLPPIRLGYFDPEKKAYRILETKAIEFPVSGGTPPEPTAVPAAQSSAPSGSKAVDHKVEPPATTPSPPAAQEVYTEEGRLQKALAYISPAMALLIAAGLLVVCLAIWMVLRYKNAHRPLRTALGRIRSSESLREINSHFREYLSAHFAAGGPGISSDELKSNIAAKVARKEQALSITCLLDQLDTLLYSGRAPSDGDLAEIRVKAEQVLESL